MAYYKVEISNDHSQSIEVSTDEIGDVTLQLDYQASQECWFLTIPNQYNNIPIVCNYNLLRYQIKYLGFGIVVASLQDIDPAKDYYFQDGISTLYVVTGHDLQKLK